MRKLFFILSCVITLLLVTPVFAAKPSHQPTVKSVCIDPGHGGSDPGAVYQDLTEKAVNLDVANLLKSQLETYGYVVFMTRNDNNTTLSNADRYNFCNNKKASILVSIHHNASSNSSVDYSQALYMKKSDVQLAQTVVNSVAGSLGITNNGISRYASGVLLKANMPATISEGFFLTNTNEYNTITSGNRLQQEATALYNAVSTFLN